MQYDTKCESTEKEKQKYEKGKIYFFVLEVNECVEFHTKSFVNFAAIQH